MCLGSGMGMSPMASRHKMAFTTPASAASATEKFNDEDSFAPGAFFSFAW